MALVLLEILLETPIQEMEGVHKDFFTKVLFAALFVNLPFWKRPNSQ